MLSGFYAAALVEFGEVLDADQNNPRAIHGRREAETKIEASMIETSKKREKDLNASVASAQKFMDEEKYRDALLTYRNVLTLDPNNIDAAAGESFIKDKKDGLLIKGESYMDDGNFYIALKQYRGALAYDPDDATMQSKAAAVEKLLGAKISQFIEGVAQNEEKEKFLEAAASYGQRLNTTWRTTRP